MPLERTFWGPYSAVRAVAPDTLKPLRMVRAGIRLLRVNLVKKDSIFFSIIRFQKQKGLFPRSFCIGDGRGGMLRKLVKRFWL